MTQFFHKMWHWRWQGTLAVCLFAVSPAHALQSNSITTVTSFADRDTTQPPWPSVPTELDRPPVNPGNNQSFSLDAQVPLHCGTALDHLAPALKDRCVLQMASWRPSRGERHHEVCALTCDGLSVHRAQVVLHFRRNNLIGLSGGLPQSAPQSYDAATHLTATAMPWSGPLAGEPELLYSRDGNQFVPAWRAVLAEDFQREEIRSAHDGALLHGSPLYFAAVDAKANVFAENPTFAPLTEVNLARLDDTGFLASHQGYVEATDVPRVHRPDGDYLFDPANADQALYFDQVQAYFHFDQAYAWFQQRFQLAEPGQALRVVTNDVIGGTGDNAIFDPPTMSIHIGRGGNQLMHLVRDADVMTHELSHFVIFQTIRARYGESVILHEGFADYFAYARQNNPFLAETVRVDGLPLRTAKLPPGTRYDDPIGLVGAHLRGQLWSAVLWDVREIAGPAWDEVVYDSLAYFPPEASMVGAFTNLLAADQAAVDAATADTPWTSQRCTILAVGVKWGFAQQLEGLNAPECNMNLAALAEDSRRYAAERRGEPVIDGPSRSVTFMGRTCSMVPGAPVANPLTMRWLWLIFVSLPILLRLRR